LVYYIQLMVTYNYIFYIINYSLSSAQKRFLYRMQSLHAKRIQL